MFLNLIGAAEGALIRAAASTQTLDPRRASRASARAGKPSRAANVSTLFDVKVAE